MAIVGLFDLFFIAVVVLFIAGFGVQAWRNRRRIHNLRARRAAAVAKESARREKKVAS